MSNKVDESKANIFYTRMRALGYKDLTEFRKDTKISLSFETCRRAINEGRRTLSPHVVVELMQTMDFTPEEIAKELKARGDKFVYKLVGASAKGIVLNERESELIDILRNPSDPELFDAIMTIVRRAKKGRE